jgi:Uma2 family endonuclease
MATATSVQNLTATMPSPTVKRVKRMTLEQFWHKYSDREDGFKYELNQGIVEKTPRRMKIKELYIADNIRRAFSQTSAYQAGDGLFDEVEIETLHEQGRRPDMAYVTKSQLNKGDNRSLPSFVIEVISDTDGINRVNNKLGEYFQAGMQVVWHILPQQKQIYVYTSPIDVKICQGEMLCSAAPAVLDFQMTANAIFQK